MALATIPFQDEPALANTCTVGLIANTHAVRHPTPGGFGKSFSLSFIRFFNKGTPRGGLTAKYIYIWGSATWDDLELGEDLLGVQEVCFPVPCAVDLARGYQTVGRSLDVCANEPDPARLRAPKGRRFRILLLTTSEGDYDLVHDEGRLVPELNRRHALPAAELAIYQGCVVACLPSDKASATEQHAVDPQDLDQNIADCYLIATLIAAARHNPEQMRNIISQTPAGYVVSFPGHEPIALPPDIDRGPDMVETMALDVNSRGEVEIWPILLERAFAIVRWRLSPNKKGPDQEFQHVTGGDAVMTYNVITGREADEHTRSEYASRSVQVAAIHEHLNSARPVMFSTGKWTQPGERPEWWKEDHVYVVMEIRAKSGTIALHDPCGGQYVRCIKLDHWFDSTEIKRFVFCH